MNGREAYEAMLRAAEAINAQSHPYAWGSPRTPPREPGAYVNGAIDTTGRDVTAKRRQRSRQQLESGPR